VRRVVVIDADALSREKVVAQNRECVAFEDPDTVEAEAAQVVFERATACVPHREVIDRDE
jgi:hypothetical protein